MSNRLFSEGEVKQNIKKTKNTLRKIHKVSDVVPQEGFNPRDAVAYLLYSGRYEPKWVRTSNITKLRQDFNNGTMSIRRMEKLARAHGFYEVQSLVMLKPPKTFYGHAINEYGLASYPKKIV